MKRFESLLREAKSKEWTEEDVQSAFAEALEEVYPLKEMKE
jgi:hypothetical protein